jgi:hypothetical protein
MDVAHQRASGQLAPCLLLVRVWRVRLHHHEYVWNAVFRYPGTSEVAQLFTVT